jgi:polyhydroxybutyrate depolymerase
MRIWFGFGIFAIVAVPACGSSSEQGGSKDRGSSGGSNSETDTSPTTPSATAHDGTNPPSSNRADAPPPTITSTTESIDVSGEPRSFVLSVPGTYNKTKSYPLVLAFHGDGGDGAQIRSALQLENAFGQDAIIAYPSGTAKTWNLYGPPKQNPDLAFITSLVDSLRARFAIASNRVFGIGFSNGAFMINQVACRRPGLFRAIAPFSGGAPSEPQDSAATRWANGYVRCEGQTLGSGPAVIVVHGTVDNVVTYQSGDFTAQYWAYINGCAETRAEPGPMQPCTGYGGCPSGKNVLLCPIDGLGHGIWSEAAKAAWMFFRGL